MSQSLEDIKHGPSYTGVNELILKRWSPRAFSEKRIAKADLKKIFTAAAWAASSMNEQPWRFLLGIKGEGENGETYQKIFDSLAPTNQVWAQQAPVLVASIAKKTFGDKGTPNRVAFHDVGAASANICLQAIDLGIHTHGMGGFSPDAIRTSFHIPEDFEPVAVWAMGYLGDPETLPEQLKERELAKRSRKTLDEYVFTNWGSAAKLE